MKRSSVLKSPFDSRVALLLANRRTVMEIKEITKKGGDFVQQWEVFVGEILSRAKREIPSLSRWHVERDGQEFEFWPDQRWAVTKDYCMAIGFNYQYVVGHSNEGEGFVHLFVPELSSKGV